MALCVLNRWLAERTRSGTRPVRSLGGGGVDCWTKRNTGVVEIIDIRYAEGCILLFSTSFSYALAFNWVRGCGPFEINPNLGDS